MEPNEESEPTPKKGREKNYTAAYFKLFYRDGEPSAAEFEALGFLVASGYTDAMIGTFYGVHRNYIYKWKRLYPEFLKVIQDGKRISDDAVEMALYNRAVGFDVWETKVNISEGSVILTDVLKHYPADVGAARYWLNNRRPDKWKDIAHVANENKETPMFDVSGLSEQQLDAFESLLALVQKPGLPID